MLAQLPAPVVLEIGGLERKTGGMGIVFVSLIAEVANGRTAEF